jgi:hypothetical protein
LILLKGGPASNSFSDVALNVCQHFGGIANKVMKNIRGKNVSGSDYL